MYSYEDRLRAVKLYLTLGKRCKATIRQLGYPTKNALKAWHDEFARQGDLPAGYARSKPKYSDEQRRAALEHWASHGRSFAFTLRALGYPCRQTLNEWVHERYPEARKCVAGKAGKPAASSSSKRAAVYELCTRKGSAQEVAHRLDVDRVTLYNWKNQLLGREAPASMKRDKSSPEETDPSELERQVETLRREIRNLQLEHDLLKKANELLKKDLGVDLQLLSNREKTMLDAAIETVVEGREKPIVHSDRGGHYRWPGWLSRVAKASLVRSMSRKACSPDNAACEGFFGRLKTEMFYPRDWRSTTIEQFIEALDTYIRWYNEKRIKGSLGYLSPIEYRESLGLVT